MKTIRDLFDHELGALYDAEHKIVKALVRMGSRCENPELVQVLDEYRAFSEKRIERLESIFKLGGATPHRSPCAGINGFDHRALRVRGHRALGRAAGCLCRGVRPPDRALLDLLLSGPDHGGGGPEDAGRHPMQDATELLATSLSEHNLAGDGFKALSINLTEKLLADAGD